MKNEEQFRIIRDSLNFSLWKGGGVVKNAILTLAILFLISVVGFSQNTQKGVKQGLDSIVSPNETDIFSYDNKGNMVLHMNHYWDGYTTSDEYMYDDNNNLIMETCYMWDYDINSWKELWKSEYTYDSRGKLIIMIDSNIIKNTDWTSRKSEYKYNNKGKLIKKIDYDWDNNNWVISGKTEYRHINIGKLTIETEYYWEGETGDWEIGDKIEYTYDNNDRLITEIYYDRNDETNDWNKFEKSEYNYDNNDNLIMLTYYEKWSDKTNTWKLRYKKEYIFDLSYSKIDLIMPVDIELINPRITYIVNNMLKETILYEWSEKDWIQENVTTYYWSPKEIIINNKK